MGERLKEGFTLIMSEEYDSISSEYLKRGNNGIGMIPACLIGDEEKALGAFPKLLETIRNSKILQLYSSGNDVVGMIGSRHYEGLYAEKENVKTYRKAYKLYGSDKYKLEEESK